MGRKRLIVCCDGTWKSSSHATDEIQTNVSKLSHCISPWYVDTNGTSRPLIVYYVAGIGAEPLKLAKWTYGGFGWGFDESLGEIYNFLATNFCDNRETRDGDDEVFFFGFSRGAYLARAAASLICRVGIVTPDLLRMYKYMYAVYRTLPPEADISQHAWVRGGSGQYRTDCVNGRKIRFKEGAGSRWFEEDVNRKAKVKVIGVWDTVSSLGVPRNQFVDISESERWYACHKAPIHPDVEHAFQALAIDEHRMPFRPDIWVLPDYSTTDLIQCWFPGMHSNIGGGRNNTNGDLEFVAGATFFWMVDRCFPFLQFDIQKLSQIHQWHLEGKAQLIRRKEGQTPGVPLGPYTGGRIIDSFHGVWTRLLGSEIRTPGAYSMDNTRGRTNEYIHPMMKSFHADGEYTVNYSTKPLVNFQRRHDDRFGWYWEGSYPSLGTTPLVTRLRQSLSNIVSVIRCKSHKSSRKSSGIARTVRLAEFSLADYVNDGDYNIFNSQERAYFTGINIAYGSVATAGDNPENLGYPKPRQQRWIEPVRDSLFSRLGEIVAVQVQEEEEAMTKENWGGLLGLDLDIF